MPAPEHAQPPPENAPPPSRRDDTSPAAGHHGPNDRLRDAWLAEMWPSCREMSRHSREEKRKDDRRQQREWEERDLAQVSPSISTGCAETGSTEMPGSAA